MAAAAVWHSKTALVSLDVSPTPAVLDICNEFSGQVITQRANMGNLASALQIFLVGNVREILAAMGPRDNISIITELSYDWEEGARHCSLFLRRARAGAQSSAGDWGVLPPIFRRGFVPQSRNAVPKLRPK